MVKKGKKQFYKSTFEKYFSLLIYIKRLRQTGKFKTITKSHWQAIINRYQRLKSSLKQIPLGLALTMLPFIPGVDLGAQCTDINLYPALLNLSMSGTNALGANASPAFSDIDGDGLEDMVVAAWPGIEVYKRYPSNNFRLMYGDQKNPFGNISTVQQSVIIFYDLIVDETNREEMFVSYGTSGIKMYIYDTVSDEYHLSSDTQNPFNFIDYQFHTSPFIYSNFNSGTIQAVIIDSDGRVKFYVLNSVGKFKEIDTISDLVDEDYRNPYLLDLNGDLLHETLVIGKSDGSLAYLEFDGSPYAEAEVNPFEEISVDDWANPAFHDFDNDGDLDLILGDRTGRVHAYTNTDGVFSLNNNSKDPFDRVVANDARLKPQFYDWNCDGEADVFLGGFSGRIEYFTRLGDDYVEPFGKNPFEGLDFGTYASLAFLDEGNDNHPIAIVGTEDGRLTMLSFNESEGLFEEIPDHSLQFVDVGSEATPSMVDLDMDGDEDLFVGSDAGEISYFRNLGDGVFQELTGSANPFNDLYNGRGSSVTFLDINGDNVKDAFVSGSQGIKYYNYTVSGFVLNEDENPFRNLEITSAGIAKTTILPNNKYEIVLSIGGGRLLTFQSFNPISTSCYNLENCLVNSWMGEIDEEWNDSRTNWSLGRIPLSCDPIVISKTDLLIPISTVEECIGLKVLSGGTLTVDGELTVELD